MTAVSPTLFNERVDKMKFIKGQNQWGTTEERRNNFIKSFNDLYKSRYEYVNGFENGDSTIEIKCLICKNVRKINAQCVRKKRLLKCDCEYKNKTKQDQMKIIKQEQKRVSNYKKYISKSIQNIKLNNQTLKYIVKEYVCLECEKMFKSYKNRKYCSKECMNRYNNSTKKHNKRKRVINNGDYQNIPLNKIIKRDNNICHICGHQCNKDDVTINSNGYKVFGKNYPSIDHVIPISCGGTNTLDNVKLAHMYCNSVKSGKSKLAMKGKFITLNI